MNIVLVAHMLEQLAISIELALALWHGALEGLNIIMAIDVVL